MLERHDKNLKNEELSETVTCKLAKCLTVASLFAHSKKQQRHLVFCFYDMITISDWKTFLQVSSNPFNRNMSLNLPQFRK